MTDPMPAAQTPPPVPEPQAPAPLTTWLPGFLVLAVIWGSSFLLIKIGIGELHPVYVTLGRVVAGAITVLVLLAATGGRLPRGWRTWGHLLLAGTLGVAIPFTLFGYGEQRVSSILAGIWNATTPLVALPLAALVFRTERLTVRKVSGVLIGFAGVLVVLGVWEGVGGAQLTGQLMCMAAAACYGVVIPYQRRFLSGLSGSGVAVPAGQLLMAAMVLMVAAPIMAGAPPAIGQLSLNVMAAVAALGALGTGLAFVLHFRVIRAAGATAASSVTFLIPLVSTVIGIVVLHEKLVWHQPVGAAVVLAGVAVSQGLLSRGRRMGPRAGVGIKRPKSTAVH